MAWASARGSRCGARARPLIVDRTRGLPPSAHDVSEAGLESAVNSIEKVVTIAAAIQLSGTEIGPRNMFGSAIINEYVKRMRPGAMPAVRDQRQQFDRNLKGQPLERPTKQVSDKTTAAAVQNPFARIQAFLVHGHEMDAVVAVKNYLQTELGMPEPTILIEKPDEGLPIQVKFEKYAMQSDVAIVFLTLDDVGGKAPFDISPTSAVDFPMATAVKAFICEIFSATSGAPSWRR
jgi:hypothetical protein